MKFFKEILGFALIFICLTFLYYYRESIRQERFKPIISESGSKYLFDSKTNKFYILGSNDNFHMNYVDLIDRSRNGKNAKIYSPEELLKN